MGTYGLRVPASHVGYVPEAQGGLPPGTTYCTYWVHVPASGVGYVPGTVATQVDAGASGVQLCVVRMRQDVLQVLSHAHAADAGGTVRGALTRGLPPPAACFRTREGVV